MYKLSSEKDYDDRINDVALNNEGIEREIIPD